MNRTKIAEILNRKYDLKTFGQNILKAIFPSFEMWSSQNVSEELTVTEKKTINQAYTYGRVELEDGTEITCYEIHLQENVRIEQSRVAIQQYVRKLVLEGDAAFINFVSPKDPALWRFTLVAKKLEQTTNRFEGKATNANRYTYLVETGEGKNNRTMAEQLEKLSLMQDVGLKEIIDAFAVEALSKAFFNEYQQHYQNFVQHLTGMRVVKEKGKWVEKKFGEPSPALHDLFRSNSKNARDFVKKLLGRIVFLYFVQRKGWMGASTTEYCDGDTDFMLNLFKKANAADRFYADWLTKLFFDTLNNRNGRHNDNFTMPDGSQVKIPFLNGGLFDRDANDHNALLLPPALFHNPDEAETPNKRGFLDFLNSYNFTVYEDSPDDHTVAVDPEMLGHIFENLLEDNKDKGAFYTPKEIVHYMCQESLLEYLKTQDPTGLNPSGLTALVKQKQSNLSPEELHHIQQKLEAVKICDPAIGSGAFPMGLLLEIFSLRELIASELNQDFDRAEAKGQIIQNSIYGVDIERGAVDIARLRFWLSLVVEEQQPSPLPNLDYKIVQGNSLMSRFGLDTPIQNVFRELNKKRKEKIELHDYKRLVYDYLHESDHEKKKAFKELIEEIKNTFKKELGKKEQNELSKLRGKLQQLQQKDMFGKRVGSTKEVNDTKKKLKEKEDERAETESGKIYENALEWRFEFPNLLGNEGGFNGFDIVIGNPPYIQLQNNGGQLAKLYQKQNYATFTRMGDIYSLFYEKGNQILKPNGTLAFITSNKWMRAGYGKATRDYFQKETQITKLIDFGDARLFENATTYTNILIFHKATEAEHDPQVYDLSHNYFPEYNLEENLKRNQDFAPDFTNDSFLIVNAAHLRLKQKIEKVGKPLKDWDVEINYGIKTGYNDAFIIDTETKDRLIAEDPRSAEIIKPVLRGRDIKKYRAEFAGLWLINTHNGIKEKGIPPINVEKEYPVIYRYLESFGADIQKRSDKGVHWSNLRNCAYLEEFEKPKIAWGNLNKYATFSFEESNFFINNPTNLMTTKSNEVSLKYLLAIFNSKITTYLMRKIGYERNGGYVEYKKVFIEQLPIPIVSNEQSKLLEVKASEIFELKTISSNTSKQEKEIDHLVYYLYGLNHDEVLLVDPEFQLSRVEWEAFCAEG